MNPQPLPDVTIASRREAATLLRAPDGPYDLAVCIRTPGALPLPVTRNDLPRLHLAFNDLWFDLPPSPALTPPTITHARAIVNFVKDAAAAQPTRAWWRVLTHCDAGICRSSAAALITLSVLYPHWPARDMVEYLADTHPNIAPNPLLLRGYGRLTHDYSLLFAVQARWPRAYTPDRQGAGDPSEPSADLGEDVYDLRTRAARWLLPRLHDHALSSDKTKAARTQKAIRALTLIAEDRNGGWSWTPEEHNDIKSGLAALGRVWLDLWL